MPTIEGENISDWKQLGRSKAFEARLITTDRGVKKVFIDNTSKDLCGKSTIVVLVNSLR
jgi:hypothetical protein